MNLQFVFFFLILYSNVCSISTEKGNELPSAAELDENAIAGLINDEAQEKWGYILKQNILYNDKYHALKAYIDHSTGEVKDFNVHKIIEEYVKSDEMDKHANLDDIRSLIQDATHCAGLKYTNLFATIILRDLLPFLMNTVNINKPTKNQMSQDEIDAMNKKVNEECDNDPEIQSSQASLDSKKEKDEPNETCTCNNDIEKETGTDKEFNIITGSIFEKYCMNFNIVTCKGKINCHGMGKLEGDKLEIDSTWQNLIRKRAVQDIEYRINLEEFNSIFNRLVTVKPVVIDLYEIVCILIFTVRNTDEKLQQKCLPHNGSFVKKYQSLSNELGEEFVQFIKKLDENGNFWKSLDDFFSQFDDSPEETSNQMSKVALWDSLWENLNTTVNDDKQMSKVMLEVDLWEALWKELDKPVDDDIKQAKYRNLLGIIRANVPFYIYQANFKDENTTEVSLDITYDKEAEEKSRFENATIRKLSFSTSFENDFENFENEDAEESNNNVSDDKNTEVYYFKGTVYLNNANLS
ncbi:uncharacterized protein LOC126834564 [Adelges cooleyi]|uniref:uncharacterized protein LOC126834564 n=1 Tax=Adelges cooleyi TaxID=133065 RepID=UPI00217F6C01|nr:uncharacterized protein LOC126834564 [Adelges cooleyi]